MAVSKPLYSSNEIVGVLRFITSLRGVESSMSVIIMNFVVFGIAVTLVALYQGYASRPTPDGVAHATTITVVVSSLLVLGLDFIMTASMFTVV